MKLHLQSRSCSWHHHFDIRHNSARYHRAKQAAHHLHWWVSVLLSYWSHRKIIRNQRLCPFHRLQWNRILPVSRTRLLCKMAYRGLPGLQELLLKYFPHHLSRNQSKQRNQLPGNLHNVHHMPWSQHNQQKEPARHDYKMQCNHLEHNYQRKVQFHCWHILMTTHGWIECRSFLQHPHSMLQSRH